MGIRGRLHGKCHMLPLWYDGNKPQHEGRTMTKYGRLADRQIKLKLKIFFVGVLVGVTITAMLIPAIINNLVINEMLQADACARGLDNCQGDQQ